MRRKTVGAILFTFWTTAALISGCASAQSEERTRCSPPPPGFAKETVIGTWVAGFPPDQVDKLVFREDGQYMQTVHVPAHGIDYESDWQEWWVEFPEQGNPYIHLEGMSLCGWAPDQASCEIAGSGTASWYDACMDTTFRMPPSEVILIVTGFPDRFEGSQRAVRLLLPAGHERSWSYMFIEP